MATLVQDLKYGLRMLDKNPGFTAVAVLTLALGIGASTAIFSAVSPILFEPLPYPHPERVMMVWGTFQGARSQVSFHNYRELLARNRSFDALAVFEPWQPSMSGPSVPERLDGQNVSYGYFRALGVTPSMGRDFQATDDAFHGPHVAIISYGLWQRRFAGDGAIVGREIRLDGAGYKVIGIMPRGFDNVLAPTAEIWVPEQYDPAHIADTNTAEWGNHLSMVARLLPGVSFAQAKTDIDTIARIPIADFPRPIWAALRFGFIVDSLQEDVTRAFKPALLAVLGAVLLVLLLASVNVTNLILAQGAQRRAEFAMRAALGAGRTRMIRQLLTESLLLALVGGALGLFVAQFGVQAVIALSPPDLPRLSAIRLDRNVFIFASGITTLIGLLVGLIPALHASQGDLQTGLKAGSRQTTGRHQATRRMLVIAEEGLALVLLVSAGLLFRSLSRLFSVHPGFDAASLLTLQVQTSGSKFEDQNYTHRFFARALEEVRRLPGVQSAAFTSLLPLTDDTQFGVYGTKFEKDEKSYGVFRYVVTPGYFETMRIPLRRGRYLDSHDVAGAPQAVVISESLAKKEFGAGDPVGQRTHVGGYPDWPWYTVVGVVGDVKQASLAASDPDAVYIAPEQSWYADQAMSLVVRSRVDAATLFPSIRKAIWSVDKDQPIVRVATMPHVLAATEAVRRFVLTLFEVFGMAALALASVGIYGVLSGSVTERTHEMGVRMALGAQRQDVLRLMLGQGFKLALIGVALGVVAALGLTRLLSSLLFGLKPTDPLTFIAVSLLLTAVALLACYLPARRATRVDPMVALRYE